MFASTQPSAEHDECTFTGVSRVLCVQVWNAGQHCFMAEASVLAALRERNRTGLAACRLARWQCSAKCP